MTHSETGSAFGHGDNRDRTEADWTALQAEVDAFARDLDGSLADPTQPGAGVDLDLRSRFATIRDLVGRLRAQSMEREATFARSPSSDVRSESDLQREEMRRQRREKLRSGARDVGDGLVKAWGEISAAVRKAADRMKSDRSRGDGGPPPPGNPPSQI